MLDMKLLRDRTEFVRERLATRNAGDEAKVTEILALDESRRSALAEAEQLKARRNSASKEIGGLIGQKRLEEAEAKRRKCVRSETGSPNSTRQRPNRRPHGMPCC